MKTLCLLSILFALSIFSLRAQSSNAIIIDLADQNASSLEIDIDQSKFVLINKVEGITYKTSWKRERELPQVLTIPGTKSEGTMSDPDSLCTSDEVGKMIVKFKNAKNESEIKKAVVDGNDLLQKISENDCRRILKNAIDQTIEIINFPYSGKLDYNETITLEIIRIDLNGSPMETLKYVFTTERRTRWLTHFGLTYAPSFISPEIRYFLKADPTVPDNFTITEQHSRSQTQVDNISPTISFTYPFSPKTKDFDFGYTAGFGLNPSLQLSGHTGLSAIIGTNIILGAGIVVIQRYNLKGEYAPGDIIKENISFESLHEKVWMPEMYFTLGLRFNANPFGGSSNNRLSSNSRADTENSSNGDTENQ